MAQVDFPTAASTADAASDSLKVHVSRVLRASRERVFDAWTKPEQMRQWMGPAGWQVPELEADARVGGKYRIVYRGNACADREGPASRRSEPGRAGERILTWFRMS